MVSSLFTAFVRWNKARRLAEQLWALDDHELDDIGIARCDIWDIARKSANDSVPDPKSGAKRSAGFGHRPA
ncbi:MAG: DUF1127 domain-containing protein [Alphaproteobacteria bacterium]|nr:DUF1127 domain-containing protein [Alphaproteobacteria bacterium]